ncbi:DUF6745 domain-containing protein [Actinocrispum sp. NPDC049592]|uniref:DUF6745 domain-containing protein n=1 Tax=Actinocrispum sp. NPDC049592 TaxID=3154835 RepID=UPI0034270C7C
MTQLMAEVRAEWLAHGLCTQPADRPAAVAGVAQAYRAAGLPPPEHVVWAGSPFSGADEAQKSRQTAGPSVQYEVHNYIYLGDSLSERISPATGNQIWSEVGLPVHAQVNAVVQAIEAELRSMRDLLWEGIEGQFKAAELSRYDMYARLGAVPCGRVAGITRVAKSAGMWWPRRDAVVLCERPSALYRDDQYRLHRADGPALVYPDGWCVYVWHGTRVPASLILDGWPIEQIVREPNSEVRRCAVERVASVEGWESLIARAGWPQVGSTVADPGNPGQTLSLYRVPDIYPVPVNLLLMTNGTPERDGTRRSYAETVPADLTDPVAAAAWQIGISADAYRQTVRRT